jgi:hypothetical protein
VPRRFKPVPVFDLSQTEGQDLPEIATRLTRDLGGDAYTKLCAVPDEPRFTVEEGDLTNGVNGYCDFLQHLIRIDERQQVKTLGHEIARAILHAEHGSRQIAELEAESVAFIVSAAVGIQSDDYRAGYVATWAGGGDEAQKAIKACGSCIQKSAGQILSALGADDDTSKEMACRRSKSSYLTELILYHLVLGGASD